MDNQNTQSGGQGGGGGGAVLHVVVFPWLAMGHLIPFFHLSTLIAQKGHTVSFVSTPRNLSRLPKIPSHLSSLVNLISFPLPRLPNLPNDAESSTDVPFHKQQLLKTAEQDGSFTRDSVAEFVRLAMVDDSDESLRARAKEMKDLFGDRNKNNRIADEFICFLEENRPPRFTE